MLHFFFIKQGSSSFIPIGVVFINKSLLFISSSSILFTKDIVKFGNKFLIILTIPSDLLYQYQK